MKVGVVLLLGEDEKLGRPPSYGEVRAMARQAEAAGFDSVWLYDHLLYRFPEQPTMGVWEGWTFLSALAEATERCELGTIVMCTAFRNPGVLAKMAATLDEVSGGRLILGLGAGWHQPEFDAFGIPFDHRAARFEEALQIIVPLLREGKVDFTGEYYAAPDCEIRPRGPRQRIPILVAAKGPRMLQLTAQYADSWNAAWFGHPSGLVAERRADLGAACRAAGRDPATLEVTVGVSVAYPDLGDTPDGIDNRERFLTGPAEEVAAGLRAYEETGVSHVICACFPNNAGAIARLGEALNAYRQAT
jgi:probable F420-dependent oxidoreductase